jgi:hypothetical protein
MRHAATILLLFAVACAHDIPDRPVLATWPMPAMSADVRDKREADLTAARATYAKNPNDADALIWVGRRLGYLGLYREAIDTFTEGVKKHPRDARMLRHRGHRWITLRDFDRAIRDLDRAAELVRGKPDQIEPDGLPNARNIPTSTLQSNIWYHLGLAHFLKGDFEAALSAYRSCMAVSKNPDGLVSTSHWLYMTLRRLGRPAEAEKVLEAISTDLDVIENGSYHRLLLMARGEIAPEELLVDAPSTVDGATHHFGVANWYICNGEPERARPLLEKIIAGGQWSSFAFIAAEVELKRMAGREEPH